MIRPVRDLVVLGWLLATPSLALAAASTPPLKGDPVRGKEIHKECDGCHSTSINDIGPPHCGVLGRKAASVPGFAYSEAMKASGIVWDEKHLDAFLTSPLAYLNGTSMGYGGLDRAQDRADVIAYLREGMGGQCKEPG